MPDLYHRRILRHIGDKRYEPGTPRQLARQLGFGLDEQEGFEQAIKQLCAQGRLVTGPGGRVAAPPLGKHVVGLFSRHERGFGFVEADALTAHGDLFIPPGNVGDAQSGDRVRARVLNEKRAGGQRTAGRIIEIIERSDRSHVGTLEKSGRTYSVRIDGRSRQQPVVIRDPHVKNANVGQKVVVEIVADSAAPGQGPEGVITEVLGDAGEPDVETQAVIRAHGLPQAFSTKVNRDARDAGAHWDASAIPEDRLDLTGTFICTIDPPDAKDFDDAISIRTCGLGSGPGGDRGRGGGEPVYELGVHIADVSHFIQAGSALDAEAQKRGNSTYLPRRVIPMLPEVLSNGVCSLQEQVNRFTKSCFITYDGEANVLSQRFERTAIRSAKRLTYLEAQALIDGDLREARKHARTEPKYTSQLTKTLRHLDELAKCIRQRRLRDGMVVLDLPVAVLVFDDSGRVIDAVPEDDAFAHTLIEMFMVEANEAAARLFAALDVPMLRRVHPDPSAHDLNDLRSIVQAAGLSIPRNPTRIQLQQLLNAVAGKPAQYAVNMAVLRTMAKAEYEPSTLGHFALASEHYTHFTSPIRRYADLVVHRGINAVIDAAAGTSRDGESKVKGKSKSKSKSKSKRKSQGEGGRGVTVERVGRGAVARVVSNDNRVPDEDQLRQIGRHCSATERNSEAAERELRTYLVLELLSEHLGEDFGATVTGVTANGLYAQIDRYCVDGVLPASGLPGNQRWRLDPRSGVLVAQRGGGRIGIGDRFTVCIVAIDLPGRQMELEIVDRGGSNKKTKQPKPKPKSKNQRRRQPRGARKAHQQTMRLKRRK